MTHASIWSGKTQQIVLCLPPSMVGRIDNYMYKERARKRVSKALGQLL